MASISTAEEAQFSIGSVQSKMSAPVPLPQMYPANLIFAQNMLAMCMSQSQIVDLNVAQLRMYLREHQLQAQIRESQLHETMQAAFAAVGMAPNGGLATAPRTVAFAATAEAAQAADAAAAPAAGGGAAEDDAAGAAAGGAEAAAEPVRLNRRRLAAAVKIAFVMILLEVRTGWFFVYFFAVFLYIGGIFDPFIEWFQRRPVRISLEQQLTDLRNRGRQVENEEQQRVSAAAAAADAAAASASSDSTAAACESTGDENAASSSDAAADGSDAGTAAQDGSATPQEGSAQAGEEAAAQDNEAPQEPALPPPPWSHRFIYQLFVMFFMTLLPSWSADPRYVQHVPGDR